MIILACNALAQQIVCQELLCAKDATTADRCGRYLLQRSKALREAIAPPRLWPVVVIVVICRQQAINDDD